MICRTCLMPSTRPRVIFDESGQCNACNYVMGAYQQIDWEARKDEFAQLCKSAESVGGYHCVVPFSGGKDSSVVAYKLKALGLNPLLVCYGQMLWTDVGRANFDRICNLGFDIAYFRHNQRVSRHLARRFFIERGHPKQHYDAGVNSVPLRVALNYNIPLIFYAEHGESFYGGNVLSEEHRRTRDLAEVLEHQVGDDPRNWVDADVSEADLAPYALPDQGEIDRLGLRAFYFSYFFKWDITKNAKYARENLGFVGIDRSDGSYEGWDSIDDAIDDLDFYMMYVKFGFGRATRMACRQIQGGHLTRERGLELVYQFDGEFPHRYLPQILNYLDLSEKELSEVADRHRNAEIWQNEGKWTLKNPPE